jgi:ribosomal protein S14
MQRLLEKDKDRRLQIEIVEKQHFILKAIVKNLNFFILIRWNAFLKLRALTSKGSKISVSNRCLYSVNKKRFSKLTTFSRHIFLKLIRSGEISGVQKSSW